MDQDKLNKLEEITQIHCGLLYDGEISIRECAIIHIMPSGNLFINKSLHENGNISWREYVQLSHTTHFGTRDIPHALIHWNSHCAHLNEGLRSAWRINYDVDLNNPGIKQLITYDIPTVQVMWMDLIRWYRNNALKQLDLEFNLALEQADQDGVEEIGLIKKMLRDLPDDIDMSQYDTYEKIVSFWPTILLPAPEFVQPFAPELAQSNDAE